MFGQILNKQKQMIKSICLVEGMLDFLSSRRNVGFSSSIANVRGTCVEFDLFFEVCIGSCLENPCFLKNKRKHSDLPSSLVAVSRLDLLYVSENRGFGIL